MCILVQRFVEKNQVRTELLSDFLDLQLLRFYFAGSCANQYYVPLYIKKYILGCRFNVKMYYNYKTSYYLKRILQ